MKRSTRLWRRAIARLAIPLFCVPLTAPAQSLHDPDSLVALALGANPGVHAAQLRVDAARDRIGPAGARSDPTLTAGVINLPVAGARDAMTMQMIGVSQTFPYPGKLALATRTASDELEATEAELDVTRLEVAAQVKRAYYTLAYVDNALSIVARTQGVLGALISTAEARYTAGNGQQADVLRARVEAARLGGQASDLQEQRRTTLAQLDAALGHSGVMAERATIPARIMRAAVADSAAHVRFASAALGARAADSPVFSLDSLQALAVVNNPMLRAREARIAAQETRLALARKAHLPDVALMLSYGYRPRFTDMVSATISLPIPIQKAHKQDADVAAITAELAALEAEHQRAVNELRADIARQVSDLERARTQLALAVRAILPESRGALESATSEYQVGRLDFAALMDAQASVFNTETSYYHSLTDFAIALTELERTVGIGVLK